MICDAEDTKMVIMKIMKMRLNTLIFNKKAEHDVIEMIIKNTGQMKIRFFGFKILLSAVKKNNKKKRMNSMGKKR